MRDISHTHTVSHSIFSRLTGSDPFIAPEDEHAKVVVLRRHLKQDRIAREEHLEEEVFEKVWEEVWEGEGKSTWKQRCLRRCGVEGVSKRERSERG
jgi:hypothetical protein